MIIMIQTILSTTTRLTWAECQRKKIIILEDLPKYRLKPWNHPDYKSNDQVVCGLNYTISGLSVLENKSIYQFGDCSVIIYPIKQPKQNPKQKQKQKKKKKQQQQSKKLKLMNGIRYQYKQLQSTITNSFCLVNGYSSSYLLVRLNESIDHDNYNHLLLYYSARLDQKSIQYLIYDLNEKDHDRLFCYHRNPFTRYILINYENRIFILHNDYHTTNDDLHNDKSNGKQYGLIKDPSIYMDQNVIGYLCINDEQKKLIQLQPDPCKNWMLIEKYFSKINFTITYLDQIYFLSSETENILVVDQQLFNINHLSQTFKFEIILKKDFVVCNNDDDNDNMDEIKSEVQGKISILFIIMIIIDIVCVMLIIYIYKKRNNKNKINL